MPLPVIIFQVATLSVCHVNVERVRFRRRAKPPRACCPCRNKKSRFDIDSRAKLAINKDLAVSFASDIARNARGGGRKGRRVWNYRRRRKLAHISVHWLPANFPQDCQRGGRISGAALGYIAKVNPSHCATVTPRVSYNRRQRQTIQWRRCFPCKKTRVNTCICKQTN